MPRSYVDLGKTPEEKAEEAKPMVSQVADYSYRHCISLNQEDLDKLDMDDDFEVGDIIHLSAFAQVTSASRRMVDGKPECCVELQIQKLAVEDESTEEAGEYA